MSAAEGGRRYDLLVFDWDGTLLDSVGSIVECTRATLAELGLRELPEAEIRATVGLSLDEAMLRLSGGGTEPRAAERVRDAYRRHWFGTYAHRPVLFAGVEALLSGLEEAGYLLAVATGKGRPGLDRDLAASGLAGRFHATRTADETRSKPHPQMLLDLLDELGASPRRTLVVGDSIWDLQMAAAAATAAVAVCTGAHPRDDLLACSPLTCLDEIRELAEWLKSG